MDKIDDGLIASTFAKVKDVDIFALKAYMEITHGAETGAQSILLDVFVNFPFFLLNLIVGLFSVILRFLKISVCMIPINKQFIIRLKNYGKIYQVMGLIQAPCFIYWLRFQLFQYLFHIFFQKEIFLNV